MKKTLPISATALAAVIALAGCSNGSAGSSGTSTSGMNHSTGGMTSAPAGMGHNAADTMFAQGMIPHHAQAVEMSEMMLKRQGIDAKVTELATRIKAAQWPEIEMMNGWLKSWGEPTQMSDDHTMSGMMGDGDLKKFDAAEGAEAAKLFLTQMIAHHEGAVQVAKSEIADGKNPDAVKLSKDIVTAQESEIQEMKALLATL